MSSLLEQKAGLNDFLVKSRRLVAQFAVVHHATPASKKLSSDISDSIFIKAEGIDNITAVDPLTGLSPLSPLDTTGKLLVLIQCLNAKSVKRASVLDASKAEAISAFSITALGNILLEVDSTIDFSAADQVFTILLDYQGDK